MKHLLFYEGNFCVKFQAPNASELTKYVLEKPEQFDDKSWAGNCILNTIPCTWQEMMPLLAPSFEQFSKIVGKGFNYTLYDPWINCYTEGSYQDIHDHYTADFACVFFPNMGENFGKFFFFDRNSHCVNPKWRKLLNIHDMWYPDISPGDIMFFPGNILHGVTVHQSTETRKTLSCNCRLDMPL